VSPARTTTDCALGSECFDFTTPTCPTPAQPVKTCGSSAASTSDCGAGSFCMTGVSCGTRPARRMHCCSRPCDPTGDATVAAPRACSSFIYSERSPTARADQAAQCGWRFSAPQMRLPHLCWLWTVAARRAARSSARTEQVPGRSHRSRHPWDRRTRAQCSGVWSGRRKRRSIQKEPAATILSAAAELPGRS